jgi:hypothetical protein
MNVFYFRTKAPHHKFIKSAYLIYYINRSWQQDAATYDAFVLQKGMIVFKKKS